MARFFLNRISKSRQYFISFVLVIMVSAICYSLSSLIGYKVVALILLVSVSLIAMFFDFFPVMLAALLSALIWNYFFIPPKFTFHVNDAEDALMLLMYFFIAMVNAALTYKIRQIAKSSLLRDHAAFVPDLRYLHCNSRNNYCKPGAHQRIIYIDQRSGELKLLAAGNHKISNRSARAIICTEHQLAFMGRMHWRGALF